MSAASEPEIEFEVEEIDFFTGQPYPQWERARRDRPVYETQPMYGASDSRHYHVTKYEDVERVLRDWQTFSSSINAEHIGQYMGELILAMDGQEHRAYRNLVVARVPGLAARAVGRRAGAPRHRRGCSTPSRPRVGATSCATSRSKYPVQVICGIVGVPLEDSAQFHQWAEEINTGPLAPGRGHGGVEGDARLPRADRRGSARATPHGRPHQRPRHAEIDGERLTDEKIYGFLRLLLPAGAETTFRVMGNALVALLEHPDVLDRVVADRELLPGVIEETLRWETSVTQVSRVATRRHRDRRLSGAGGLAHRVLTGSGEPRRGPLRPTPDEFDLDRPAQHHLAFGTGQHQCLGMHLARLELRVGLDAILTRLPNLRLDADGPAPVIVGTAFRGPEALPVLFDT